MRFNKLLVFMVFAIVACALTVGSVSAASNNSTELADSAWPEFQNNNNKSGQSVYNGPQTNTTKWTTNMTFGNGGSVVIGSDGTIYAGSSDKNLYALRPNGTKLWSYNIGSSITNAPAIGNNGVIYVFAGGNLTALSYDGSDVTKLWSYATGKNSNYASPTIGPDGTIYLGNNGFLSAVNPNGTSKWNATITGVSYGSPAVGSDGTIYISTSSGKVYALNPDGSQKWLYTDTTQADAKYGLTIDPDGTIYVIGFDGGGTMSGNLYALNPADGTVKWIYHSTLSSDQGFNMLTTPPSVGSDGTVYFGSEVNAVPWTGVLYAVDSNGTELWKYSVGGRISQGAPIIGADGTIYLGTSVGFFAFNPNGTLKWRYATGAVSGGSAIGSDGTLYIKGSNILFAIQDLIGDFTSTPGSGLDVQFNDTSTNIPTSWSWDFGDGTTSSDQNPTHTYSAPGKYNVTLTVGIANGVNTTVMKEITVNLPPTLDPIGDKSVVENKSISFIVVGHDTPGDNLTYSVSGLPDGASFDENTGVFSWTPSHAQVGTYTITFTVSDGSLSTSKTVTIVVNVNRPPVLGFASISINENQPLNFSLGGSDEDGDTLTYSATGLPAGATINSATGVFSWIPSFSQAGTYHITFSVFDGSVTVSKIISIVVNDVDNVAPKVTKVDPAKNTVIRVTQKVINVTFNEQIKNGSLWVELKNSSGVPLKVTTKIVGNVLTITPASALANGKYTLTLNAGAFADLVGNGMAAYSTSFSVDTVTPTVKTIDPKNGATKVAASKTLKVVFSEAIKAGNVSLITLKNSSGKAVSYKYKISGSTLTIDPTSNLAESLYTLTLGKGAVTDLVGNQVAAKTSKFSVGKAPTVSKVDPKNGATKVSRSKAIQVTFNEAIKKGTYKIVLKDSKGKTVKVTASVSGKVLSIKHAKLAANTKYKLYIYAGAITDKAGNPVAAKTYTFTTGKT